MLLIRNLGLPLQVILSIDLRGDRPLLGALERRGADDVLWAHHGLVVVDVGGAGWAEVAVDRVA